MKEKNNLGRGLSSLLGNPHHSMLNNLNILPNMVVQIPVNDIMPNPFQPRKIFHSDRLHELVTSIQEQGIIQPLIVRKQETDYQLIAGERRLRAAKLAEFDTVPCLIEEFNDKKIAEIALIENLQREDLDPLDEAEAYKKLIVTFHYTQDTLSQRIGKSRSYVANILRLIHLPKAIKEALQNKLISVGHARSLINSKSPLEDLQLILTHELNVRDTENLIKGILSEKISKEHATPPLQVSTADSQEKKISESDNSDLFSSLLKMDVKIKSYKKGIGTIKIQYRCEKELEMFKSILLNHKNTFNS